MSSKLNDTAKSIAEYEREISTLKAENEKQKAEIDKLRLQIDRLNELLLNAQRARFGQSGEKQKYVSPDQPSLFNEAEKEQDPKAPEPDEDTIGHL